MSTPRDLLNAAKAEIREVEPIDVAARLDHYTLLDVREPDEYEQGAVPGAVHVARGNLEFSIEGRLPDKNAPIAVYCAGGVRSAFATNCQRIGNACRCDQLGALATKGIDWEFGEQLRA